VEGRIVGDSPPVDPQFTPAEGAELGHIAYFLAQWDTLRDRGAIPGETHAAVAAEYEGRRGAIRRRGESRGAWQRAKSLAAARPEEAATFAERAVRNDPEWPDPWWLATDLLLRLGRDDAALALATEGAARFEALNERVDAVRARIAERAEVERRRRDAEATLAEARAALDAGRPAEAVAACGHLLADRPGNADAIALLALAHYRLGNVPKSLELHRELARIDPAHASSWARRADEVSAGLAAAPRDREPVVFLDDLEAVAEKAGVAPAQRPPSWSSIAAEFVEEHWQKLILCLAVLLIVVSSTVGAHHLLGERLLWSRLGQCLLALVYTATVGLFGFGLVRWGAERAGRIMLVTTLAVIPVNFSLAGELRLLTMPTTPNLALLGMVMAVLLGLCWMIAGALGMRRGGLFPAAFFALGAFNAAAARGMPEPWELAALLLASVVFLAAVWRLNADSERAEPSESERDFLYFALGLLTYAFLFTAYRSGIFVLQLIPRQPPLLALPVMFAAIASVLTAHHLPRFEKDPRRVHLLRLAGLVLAGLAFALALAHAPAPSALLSGNTTATALLGLGLFAALLASERHPSYLYFSFGALVVAYFGAYYFIRDLMEGVLLAAGHALGYREKLPLPFKALNGVVFNLVLARLAVVFVKSWKDDRLARHCHRIGLPLAIAACVFSEFEPKAAVICLACYAPLFAGGAWLFAQPGLIYLACAAAVGSAAFATILVPGITLADYALGASAIGLTFWLVARLQAAANGSPSYRLPTLHAACAMASVAVVPATLAALPPAVVVRAVPWTFLAVTLLLALVTLEVPRRLLATAALGAACAGALLLVVALERKPIDGASAIALALVAEGLAIGLGVLGAGLDRFGGAGRLRVFARPAHDLALGLVVLGLACAVERFPRGMMPNDARGMALAALAWLLGAGALCLSSLVAFRLRIIAYAAVSALAVACAGGTFAAMSARGITGLAPIAIAAGAFGLSTALVGDRLDRARATGREPLYRGPLLHAGLIAAGLTAPLAVAVLPEFWAIAAALALASAALVVASRVYPEPAAPWAATAFALGAWLSFVGAIVRGRALTWPVYGLLAVGFAIAALVVAEAASAIARRREGAVRARAFAAVLPDAAIVILLASVFVVAAGLEVGPAVIAALALIGGGLIVATRRRRVAPLVYVGLGVLSAAVLCLGARLAPWADLGKGVAWLAVASSAAALLLWGSGVLGRRAGAGGFYVEPAVVMSITMATVACEFALVARFATRASYPIGVGAVLGAGAVFALLAATRRSRALGAIAVGTIVGATYLALLSAAEPDPSRAYVLGLVAAAESILLGLAGLLARRWLGDDLRPVAVAPLLGWALALAVASVPLAYDSPISMVLAALAFALMIWALPAALWLYAVVGCAGLAVYFRFLDGLPEDRLIGPCLLGALALWVLGFLVRRGGPALRERLRWKPGSYDDPFFLTGLGAAAAALAVRVDLGLRGDLPWSSRLLVLPALAGYMLLALKAYPARGWVHASLGFLTAWAALATAPYLIPWPLWFLSGVLAAVVWLATWRGFEVIERPLCEWLGIPPDRYATAARDWSLAAFAAATSVGLAAIVEGVAVSIVPDLWPAAPLGPRAWAAVLAAIALAGAYCDVAGGRPGLAWLRAGVCLVPALVALWCGSAGSPILRRTGLDAADFLPPAVAFAALLTTALGLRPSRDVGPSRAAIFEQAAWPIGATLAVLAPVATFGALRPVTPITLAISCATLALLARSRRRAEFAALAGFAWALTPPLAVAIDALRRDQGFDRTLLASFASLAEAGAGIVLLWVAGRCRRAARRTDIEPTFARLAAFALEGIALVGVAIAGVVAVGPAIAGFAQTNAGLAAGVATLLILTASCVVLAGRWRSEVLVYVAQAALVGTYFLYRSAYPFTPAGDAVILVLLGFLDLGVAEVMERLGLHLYARPTLYFSLVMPLIPIVLALREGLLDDATLFVVFATGTFYAVACLRLQWKGLGYAAAVLYNAFLWVAWARASWSLVDHPEFYLIPPGLSAILFAEVNRAELGRPYVNALRTAGLALIYLSLAVPIWRFESLGAWATLLILSLLGIFVGIGLRSQTFLWLGLVCFSLDVVYQLGRVGMENALARVAIMLGLGIALVVFVALNEKKQIVLALRSYYDQARQWD
jgi:tetratricopeptide (TPR) repeat protein